MGDRWWSWAQRLLMAFGQKRKHRLIPRGAVFLVLQSFGQKLAGHRVKWFTDNQDLMYIIQSGSKREYLQEGALEIHNICLVHNIKLEVEWTPRSNEYAYCISCIIDYEIRV